MPYESTTQIVEQKPCIVVPIAPKKFYARPIGDTEVKFYDGASKPSKSVPLWKFASGNLNLAQALAGNEDLDELLRKSKVTV